MKDLFRKASFTVEAALLMPVLLLVIFGVLYLDFHIQDKNVLLLSACEQAVSGHDGTPFIVLSGDGAERSRAEDGTERSVSYSSKTRSIYGSYVWQNSVSASYSVYDPVSFVRKIKAVGELIGDDGSE